ncbi:hypothetical protein QN372_19270 [Undibacterium sp. RTI2.1]|uniref:hypothetical protein n=1 Tax=unclassified Undibacterium TaxID=2630295 RepID=UPI002B22F34C|nr:MULTISPECIES: hypothetical protein [unclassified Undibacterium]MEB0032894.1 hypothetical protein [Undibacterium sp. RTI2.1]MEB0118799.1 hypothetical protein [Undibacterium sp. RTI2.2]
MKRIKTKVRPIVIGTRVYTDSLDRGEGVVYAIHSEQTPTEYDVVFHDGVKGANLTEHAFTGPRWSFLDGISSLEEITDLLAKSASSKAQNIADMQKKSLWNRNDIQFPRLIAEIMASQLLDTQALTDTMDITLDELNELCDRAQQSWHDAQSSSAQKCTKEEILVSLNGGQNFIAAKEGVRIIYQNVMVDGEDGRGELHINATHEGLISDVWTDGICDQPGSTPSDYNIGTESSTIDDIVHRLVTAND